MHQTGGGLMNARIAVAAFPALLCAAGIVRAAPQPIEHFARLPQMQGVTISPDGRYVAFLSGSGEDTVLMTYDRTKPGSEFKWVTASDPGKFDIGACQWANETRLVCSVYGNVRGKKFAELPFKRVFAVDADGGAQKVLEETRNDGNLFVNTTSMRNLHMNYGSHVDKSITASQSMREQAEYVGPSVARNYVAWRIFNRQDDILDLLPGDKENVLIMVDDDRDSYRSVFLLNIYNGKRGEIMFEHPPIQHVVTDGDGNVRVGWGTSRALETRYFARLDGEREWRPLNATAAPGAAIQLRPIAMTPASNMAYAIGNYADRDSLWSLDLTDKQDPRLLFHHPLVDVGEPILQSDRRLLGVRYDVERPYVWYADQKFREVIDRRERLFPNRVHDIIDSSQDKKTLIIQSSSDVDAGTYYVYDIDNDKLQRLGNAYPELNMMTLGKMTHILYKASDGTEIPGYLTVPTGAERKNLPLIVMPHDGPLMRDSWNFSFLRNFLANRGYAVLQMNYRGSAGFGGRWRLDGRPDWDDVIYSDIQDATRWAVSEGIADPQRICIVGWGFGGYQALSSAAREGDRYRCAISIAGISDLEMQRVHAVRFGDKAFLQQESGADAGKRIQASPLHNAAEIKIPVLLIHGTKDWQVQMDHSKAMADALAKHKKSHSMRLIEGGSHELERESHRKVLLQEVEGFLARNLGPQAGG
jgi:dipeptidyl aminopeptidase/acylaminoacyl peptidase